MFVMHPQHRHLGVNKRTSDAGRKKLYFIIKRYLEFLTDLIRVHNFGYNCF